MTKKTVCIVWSHWAKF